jgi:glutathione S-transferase
MKLFHAPRARSLRVLWLLEEMGLDCEVTLASLIDPSPEFLAVNPARTLPVFIDGDVHMTESVAILQYLANRYGPTPLAVDPDDARYPAYLQALAFGEASLAAPLNALFATQFLAPEDQKSNWTADRLLQTHPSRLKLVELQLERGDYMAGDAFTLADISVGYGVGLCAMILNEIPASVAAYHQRVTARPAYQRASAR